MSKKMSDARLKAEVYDILHADDPERNATIKKWSEQLFGSNNQKKGVNKVDKTKGNKISYENPSKRGKKFAESLKKENSASLSATQKAFRSGYLQSQKDNSTAYKLKKGQITVKDL